MQSSSSMNPFFVSSWTSFIFTYAAGVFSYAICFVILVLLWNIFFGISLSMHVIKYRPIYFSLVRIIQCLASPRSSHGCIGKISDSKIQLLSDNNGTRTYNQLVRKWTHWPWVRVPLQSLNYKCCPCFEHKVTRHSGNYRV